jgi:putative tricarboxylic transport membrane protein
LDRRHILSGLFWLAISIFVCIMAIKLGVGTFSSPGSGFLFFWSSLILGALSVILITKSILGKREAKLLLIDLWKGLKWGKAVLAIITLFLYALILTKLGFILTTFVLMILLFGIGKLKYWVTIISAFFTVMLSYIIFHFLLQIQFPRGIFGW